LLLVAEPFVAGLPLAVLPAGLSALALMTGAWDPFVRAPRLAATGRERVIVCLHAKSPCVFAEAQPRWFVGRAWQVGAVDRVSAAR
jgi:hypothetical protein